MIEWTFFYRLLGIPEEVSEPTVYQLLGFTDPRQITRGSVRHMLTERKKLLRQSIPGPQFIPMVSVFEKELDRAAAIILDPEKRRAYHQRVLAERHARRKVVAVQAASRRVVVRAREVIRAALNEDGMIEAEKRSDLADELRGLSVPEDDVAEVLAKIPTPAPGAAEPSAEGVQFFANAVDLAIDEGVLTPGDDARLADLAAKLGIPEAEAARRIEEQLQARGARRGEYQAVAEPQSVGVADSPVGDGGDVSEIIELIDSRLNGLGRSPKARSGVWQAALRIGIPVAVVVAFVAFLLMYNAGVFARRDDREPRRSKDSVAAPVEEAEPPDIEEHTEPEKHVEPAVPLDETVAAMEAARLAASDKNREPPDTSDDLGPEQMAPPPVKNAEPPPAAGLEVSTPLADQLRVGRSSDGGPEALLTDVVLSVIAAGAKAEEFVGRPDELSGELEWILERDDRAADLTHDISVPVEAAPPPPVLAASSAIDLERLKTLKEDVLGSRAQGKRYQAIEELRVINSRAAAEVLLEALEAKARKDIRICRRILRALQTMSDPNIARRLIDLIPRSHASVAHLIVHTLIEETSDYLHIPLAAAEPRLPLKHNRDQMLTCVRWWDDKQKQGQVSWGTNRLYQDPAGGLAEEEDEPAWQPDPLPAKLLVALARRARMTADELASFNWDQNGGGSGSPDRGGKPVQVGPALEADLLASLDAVVYQLSRIVREHPDGQTYAVKADVVELEKEARTLASDTSLQRAAVSLDAIGGMLALIARELDAEGQLEAPLAELARKREAAMVQVSDVLDEMREHALYNLMLWEVLCQVKG